MDDKIQHYRQPMVTATGIVLGFVLNFASQWANNAFTSYRFKEFVIGTSLCICVPILLAVLYRTLNMHYPREKAASYYQITLALFITGIGIPFLAIIIVMIESYLLHRA